MRLLHSLVTLSALAALSASCAASPPAQPQKPSRACFWTRDVDNFAAVDEERVNVRVRPREVFQLELAGPCLDIEWSSRIALTSRGGSSICEGYDAEIVAPGPSGVQRCIVRSVRRLTEAEAAALPPSEKP